MKFIAVLCLALALARGEERVDYTGHKVISFIPTSEDQLEILRFLLMENPEFDFWIEPKAVGVPVHLRMSPETMVKFDRMMSIHGNVPFKTKKVMMEDLQQAINEERKENENAAYASESVIGRYARVSEMHTFLDEMAARHPNLAEVFVIGTTYEGRQIKGIKIGETNAQDKPVIWIHAGIHAREWVAPASCMYIIDQLLSKYDTDANIKKLVDGAAWYLTPSANPDGYEYSHTTDRLWRKTRTPNAGYSCKGADPNRNWDDHFGGTGTSGYPCSDIYRGSHAFSEPNSKALSQYILGIKDRVKGFFSLHSYSQAWLTSWGWTDRINPPDHMEIQRVAKGGTDAVVATHRKYYFYGPGGQVLYPAAGAEDDWAKSKAGIKYSFTIELRPGPNSMSGFILPAKQIIPTGEEVWAGIQWVVKDVCSL